MCMARSALGQTTPIATILGSFFYVFIWMYIQYGYKDAGDRLETAVRGEHKNNDERPLRLGTIGKLTVRDSAIWTKMDLRTMSLTLQHSTGA